MQVCRDRDGGKRVESKDRGEVCNSLLSPSPAPSPNLPRTINQIRRQTLIEDCHATGSTIYTDTDTQTHTHTLREMEYLNATGSNRAHTSTLMLTRKKKFAAHICSSCTDFYQLDCTMDQSHCVSVGSQWEVRAHETEQAQREHIRSERARG